MTTEQMTLPLIFLSGILGSAHCIGMCGGIAATMSLGTRSVRAAIIRQLLWSIGRTFTYAFLGMMAATAGAGIMRTGSNTLLTQSAFAVVAGILLILQGMHAGGWLRFRIRRRTSPCLTMSLFSQFLKGGSATGVLIAGVLTGFLPCGLVYSFLALAASTGHVGNGLLVMVSFGMGTIPVMLITGMGFSLATLNVRKQLLRLSAVCVLTTGIMTAGRGIAFASQSRQSEILPACPVCELTGNAAPSVLRKPGSAQ